MASMNLPAKLCVAAGGASYGVALGVAFQRQRRSRFAGTDNVVQSTGRLVAAYRALESSSSKPLFKDPYAEALAGSVLSARGLLGMPLDNDRLDHFAIRTRFVDEQLLEALRATPGAQVVILGAGMDSRAWRLAPKSKPAGCLFEVDYPTVFEVKDAAVAALKPTVTLAAKRVTVGVDLGTGDWPSALEQKGFNKNAPTVFLLEGLTQYLSEHEVEALMAKLAPLAAPKSRFIATILSKESIRQAQASNSEVLKTWKFGTDEPEAFVKKHGWKPLRDPFGQLGDRHASYGRWKGETAKPRSEQQRRQFLAVASRA